MRILVLNGPNLGTLGRREPEIYGSTTLVEIVEAARAHALERGSLLDAFHSNHEGALIDRLEQLDYDAVICNFGALSHTSYALHDALVACERPAIEVHISDVHQRDEFRHNLVLAPVVAGQIIGRGVNGYLEAIDLLLDELDAR